MRISHTSLSRAVSLAAVLTVVAASLVMHPRTVLAESVSYQVLTNEIAAKQTDGSTTEVYRLDPAVYVAAEGDDVTLRIRGLKGHDHPLVLEGYNLHTVVHRNEVTTLHFKATKPGFFRIICTAHADANHEGPMEGYLLVIPERAAKAAAERARSVPTMAH